MKRWPTFSPLTIFMHKNVFWLRKLFRDVPTSCERHFVDPRVATCSFVHGWLFIFSETSVRLTHRTPSVLTIFRHTGKTLKIRDVLFYGLNWLFGACHSAQMLGNSLSYFWRYRRFESTSNSERAEILVCVGQYISYVSSQFRSYRGLNLQKTSNIPTSNIGLAYKREDRDDDLCTGNINYAFGTRLSE